MEIVEMKIGEIEPYSFNNRNHDEQQVDRIANSIQQFGFNQPIVIDENNVILVGHGRLLAAQKLGLKTAPVLKKTGLTETQKKAYRILDNKLQNDSTWSFDNLELELGFLEDNGFELEPWGLDELRDLFTPEEPEVYEDDPVECENDETFIKLGDVIELGPHRVMCGDAAKDQLEKTDLLLTDPPYGISMDKGFEGFGGFGEPIARRQYRDDWDATRPEAAVFEKMLAATKKAIIFGGNFFADILPQGKHWIFWDKEQTMPTFGDGELAWTNIDRKSIKKFTVTYNGLIGKEKERYHPTQKPVKIMGEIIKEYGDDVKTILDPYLGSGTTLIAADQLGRICYGMEIEPKYCHVIIERYKQHCAKVGKPFECKINGEKFDGAWS